MPYASQFSLMRQKAEGEGITLSALKDRYRESLIRAQRDQSTLSTDLQQFRAENDTWIYFWPEDPFPGVRPKEIEHYASTSPTLPQTSPQPHHNPPLRSNPQHNPRASSDGNRPYFTAFGKVALPRQKVQCGNCQEYGHSLSDCVGPVDETGHIAGCPKCNSKGHLFGSRDCKAKYRTKDDLKYMIKYRTHKPPLLWDREISTIQGYNIEIANGFRPWTPQFSLQQAALGYKHHHRYSQTHEFPDNPQIRDPAWDVIPTLPQRQSSQGDVADEINTNNNCSQSMSARNSSTQYSRNSSDTNMDSSDSPKDVPQSQSHTNKPSRMSNMSYCSSEADNQSIRISASSIRSVTSKDSSAVPRTQSVHHQLQDAGTTGSDRPQGNQSSSSSSISSLQLDSSLTSWSLDISGLGDEFDLGESTQIGGPAMANTHGLESSGFVSLTHGRNSISGAYYPSRGEKLEVRLPRTLKVSSIPEDQIYPTKLRANMHRDTLNNPNQQDTIFGQRQVNQKSTLRSSHGLSQPELSVPIGHENTASKTSIQQGFSKQDNDSQMTNGFTVEKRQLPMSSREKAGSENLQSHISKYATPSDPSAEVREFYDNGYSRRPAPVFSELSYAHPCSACGLYTHRSDECLLTSVYQE